MKYPGGIITKGESDRIIVKEIQQKLIQKGCGPLRLAGKFDLATSSAVKLFQSHFCDTEGNALRIDGAVGPITWAALFGKKEVPVAESTSNTLLNKVLEVARSQVGVRERPSGSNSGIQVDEYLDSVGLPPGKPWSLAFVYWCFDQASIQLDINNPLIKTGAVFKHWNHARCKKIESEDAIQDPSLVKPGHIFMMSLGKGRGHSGIVEKVGGGYISTIEGNAGNGGRNTSIGVFRRVAKRKINSINRGFLNYG